jgi:hypothetical protein
MSTFRCVAAVALSLLCSAVKADNGGERPNTVLIHPGECLYARFEESGPKLSLIEV